MRKKLIALSLCTSILLTGCTTTEFQNSLNTNVGKIVGTGLGAAVGAGVGHKAGGKKGAVVGAFIGGTIGYLIGSSIDERRASIKKIAEQEKIQVHFEDVKNEAGEKIGQAFITEDKYQFNTASDVLNLKAKKYFTTIGKQYAKSKQKVLIIGHTDDRGSDSYNYTLSEKRASTVAQIFKDAGVEGKNIYIYGLGETKPIASNLTKEGQGKNRRVEIVEAPSEKEIARYAYLKPTNGKLFNKEKVDDLNKEAIKKGKEESSKKPKIEDASKIVTPDLPSNMNGNNNQNGSRPPSLDSGSLSSGDSLGNPSITNFRGNQVYVVGDGVADNKGQCKDNDFLYYAKNNGDKIVLSGGEKYKQGQKEESFEKVVGMPIENTSFSVVTKAYASTSDEFYSSCLEDAFKEKGSVKNFETGREVLINNVVTQIPWLDGTQWYGDVGDSIISISPISVSVNNVEPITCPNLNFIKKGNGNPTLSMSTKVVTRQGDKGFIYRVYPTIKNSNSNFECMDVAFSDIKDEKVKAYLYYSENGRYFKREATLSLLTASKDEEKSKGLFSW
ncbi:OmpA family protein [Campylobacterota bacterium DY0563]